MADDKSRSSEICKAGGKIKALLYYEEANSVIIITPALLVV